MGDEQEALLSADVPTGYRPGKEVSGTTRFQMSFAQNQTCHQRRPKDTLRPQSWKCEHPCDIGGTEGSARTVPGVSVGTGLGGSGAREHCQVI